MACEKDFELALAGGMDARSPSGRVQFSDCRLILNMDGSEQRGYCRLGGWQPYLKNSELGFKNQDLHDQMVGGQYYAKTYTYTYTSSSELVGYVYPIFYPGFHVDDYTRPGAHVGPFCGYSLSSPYGIGHVLNGFGITSQFAGPPYTYIQDPDCVGGTWIVWEVQVRSSANSFEELEVSCDIEWDSNQYGPGSDTQTEADAPPTFRIHTLRFCLPPDATNVTITGYNGHLISGPTKLATTCSPPSTPSAPCITADCYRGSYYYLDYTFSYPGYDVPPYMAGSMVPIFEDTGGNGSVEIAYPGLYYLANQCREAITALYPMNSVGGRRRLIAATRSRIYVNDDRNGNWRILADGLGGGCDKDDDCTCSNKRFRIAALGNTVLFTNGVDPVLAWEFDSGPEGAFFWSADYVAQLRQLLIDGAEVLQSWNGFAFIANVSENGDKFTSRIYWSDYNDALSWIPGGESLAGFHDFGNGEKVLSMQPIGGRMRIFTDKAIYDCILVRDPEQVFSFQEIYRGPNVLRYRFGMVNTGDMLVWLGESSIYVMAEYDRTPQRIEWIHQAAGVIYEGVRAEWVKSFAGLASFGSINKNRCDQAVGGWDSERQAIWFSWPTGSNQCPNMSLVLWPRYFKASIVDHGFTAFANHRPDYRQSIRDFLWTRGFCEALDLLQEKEGLPYSYGGGEYYQYLFNRYESTEYPMDPDSAIASLCGVCLHDICESCDVDVRFLMASATDKTIKEFTPSQKVREMASDVPSSIFPDTSTATYSDVGYYSLMQGDGYDFKTPVEKVITAVSPEFIADIQTTPNSLYCQIGFGGGGPECLDWQDSDAISLECLDGPAFDSDSNLRPGELPRFAFFAQGVWLAWRLYTSGSGGGVCLSSLTMSLKRRQGCW